MIGDKLYLGLSLIPHFVRLLPEVEVGSVLRATLKKVR